MCECAGQWWKGEAARAWFQWPLLGSQHLSPLSLGDCLLNQGKLFHRLQRQTHKWQMNTRSCHGLSHAVYSSRSAWQWPQAFHTAFHLITVNWKWSSVVCEAHTPPLRVCRNLEMQQGQQSWGPREGLGFWMIEDAFFLHLHGKLRSRDAAIFTFTKIVLMPILTMQGLQGLRPLPREVITDNTTY